MTTTQRSSILFSLLLIGSIVAYSSYRLGWQAGYDQGSMVPTDSLSQSHGTIGPRRHEAAFKYVERGLQQGLLEYEARVAELEEALAKYEPDTPRTTPLAAYADH